MLTVSITLSVALSPVFLFALLHACAYTKVILNVSIVCVDVIYLNITSAKNALFLLVFTQEEFMLLTLWLSCCHYKIAKSIPANVESKFKVNHLILVTEYANTYKPLIG